MASNLVVVRAGPNSVHGGWLIGKKPRNFDLLVVQYAEGLPRPAHPGVEYDYIPGTKVAGWHAFMRDRSHVIDCYDRVAFIDEDIQTDADGISLCFDVGEEHRLSIWQPSLSWDSYFTFAGTLHNPAFLYRSVTHVEMMCPFFTRAALLDVQHLFSYGWESGIDLVWQSAVAPDRRRFGIVDAVQVRHCEPVGVKKEANGFADRRYETDIYACLDHFGMKWPSLVALQGVTRRGRAVGPIAVSATIPALLMSIPRTPQKNAPKLVANHLRHQITRRPGFSDTVRAVLQKDAA